MNTPNTNTLPRESAQDQPFLLTIYEIVKPKAETKREKENAILAIQHSDFFKSEKEKHKDSYIQAIERAYMDCNDESDCVVNIHAANVIGIMQDSGEEFIIDRDLAKSIIRFFNFSNL